MALDGLRKEIEDQMNYKEDLAACETRDEAAAVYAKAILIGLANWPKLNRAIIDKWSVNGLKYVKERAWKLIRDSSYKEKR
mgnify:CR=1 FL=1